MFLKERVCMWCVIVVVFAFHMCNYHVNFCLAMWIFIHICIIHRFCVSRQRACSTFVNALPHSQQCPAPLLFFCLPLLLPLVVNLSTKKEQKNTQSKTLEEEVATLQKELAEIASTQAKAEYEVTKPELDKAVTGIQLALKTQGLLCQGCHSRCI